MKVLFDDIGFREQCGGVSKYFCELVKRTESVVAVKETVNLYLRDIGFAKSKQTVHDFINDCFGGRVFPGVSRLHRFLARVFPRKFSSDWLNNERYFKQLIREGDFDLVHLTAPHHYGNLWKFLGDNIPIVITVHDLIAPITPPEILKKATRIIAVSEFTRKCLVQGAGVEERRISVVHHGCESYNNESWNHKQRGDYILFVGKKNGYKNFEWMANACQPVLVEMGLELRTTDGRYSEEEMRELYRCAAAFVYPSRCEGFGIPILESMSCGCPVLCSDIEVFHEVAGNAAEYFRLDDEDDFRNKLKLVIMNADCLRKKGYDRVAQFSWERCAKETQLVYLSAIHSH